MYPDLDFTNVKELQRQVGMKQDGDLGPGTTQAVEAYKYENSASRDTRDKGTPVAQLAKSIGINSKHLASLIKIESNSGGYTALNPNSGAYGKYQFMPATAAAYKARLGLKGNSWMSPSNQDKMFSELTKDNLTQLKRDGQGIEGIDVNNIGAFELYGAHQQGVSGFLEIMKNKNIPQVRYKNMRANIGKLGAGKTDDEVRDIWIKLWRRKTSK